MNQVNSVHIYADGHIQAHWMSHTPTTSSTPGLSAHVCCLTELYCAPWNKISSFFQKAKSALYIDFSSTAIQCSVTWWDCRKDRLSDTRGGESGKENMANEKGVLGSATSLACAPISHEKYHLFSCSQLSPALLLCLLTTCMQTPEVCARFHTW